MDDADRASAYEEAMTSAALATHAKACAPSGAVLCLDCGEPIQPARLTAIPWATRCVMCQYAADRRSAVGV